MSKYGVISGRYFPVFGLNTGKYGPEITLYLDTFHAVFQKETSGLLSGIHQIITLIHQHLLCCQRVKERLPALIQIRAAEKKLDILKFVFIKVTEIRTQLCQKCYSMWIFNNKNTVSTGPYFFSRFWTKLNVGALHMLIGIIICNAPT